MSTIINNKSLITIGIPTYMRKDTIVKRIEELKKKTLPEEVEVLVIDNASTDGTFEALTEQCRNTDIKVLQNPSNLGFHGNFVQLLKKCNGNYLLYSSDEDEILIENLREFINFLKKTKPSFVSPQYMLGGKLYRGKRSINDMKASDIWHTTHLPGLVFHIGLSREFASDFNELQLRFPSISTYYPHLELFTHLLVKGEGYWYNEPLTQQIDFLQHNHSKETDGTALYSLSSRWKQWKEYREYLDYYQNKYNLKDVEIIKLKGIINAVNKELYDRIRTALSKESPEYAEFLDYGAINRMKNQLFLNRVKNKLKKLIRVK